MSSENHIVQFKLDEELIKKLMSSKKLVLDHKRNGSTTELVLPDTRIKLEVDKRRSPNSAMATYYNNKSKDLYYFGKTETAIAIVTKVLDQVDKKRPSSSSKSKTKEDVSKRIARGIESLDIPSVSASTSPPNLKSNSSPITTGSLKKSSAAVAAAATATTISHNDRSSNNNNIRKPTKPTKLTSNSTNNNSIPLPTTTTTTATTTTTTSSSSNRGGLTPQNNTPRPISTTATTTTSSLKINPNDKLSDQVAQLLALRPYQISTLAKILETTQWEVKKALDEVGLNIPDKKKYCLKPLFYDKIKIWNNPIYTAEDRHKIIANAREAYDVLRLPSDAIERYNLLDPTNRAPPAKPKKLAPLPPPPPPTTTSSSKATMKKEEGSGIKRSSLNKASLSPITKGSNHKSNTPSGLSSYNNNNSRTPPPLSSDSASKSPLATKQKLPSSSSSQQKHQESSQLLKPSSSNKKPVGAKALPTLQHQHEKLSPPTKRKSSDLVGAAAAAAADHAPHSHSAPPTSHYSSNSTTTSSKRMRSSFTLDQSSISPPRISRPLELSNIKTQNKFDKYCLKFISGQKEYQTIKSNFRSKFPHYIQVLKSTNPPTTTDGGKRSWYDMKVEYYELVKNNYLKTKDQKEEWEEVMNQLRDCQRKRNRLNYMWSSIEKNIHQHHYKLNHKL